MFSASNYHWINYSDDKMDHAFRTAMASAKGTRLHELAKKAISDGIRLSEDPEHMTEPYQATMALYVNDAITLGLTAEQILFYSINFYGTADAIGFRDRFLRIHDLKTGVARTSEKQLYVYAAYFCLEYEMNPYEIETELRIYQNDEVRIYRADPDLIMYIMEKVTAFNERIEAQKSQA
jgi:hypothetical protein